MMKLASYLFCLSLAAASGVMPAGAQQVHFTNTAVRNFCPRPWDIILNPQRIYIMAGDTVQVYDAPVPMIGGLAGFLDYYPTRDLDAHPGSACVFGPCGDYVIKLSCRALNGNLTSVDWKRRPGKK
jgi:hypothetical protein